MNFKMKMNILWQEFTLASDGESGRPSRSCNLFKSGILPTESAPFLSRLWPGATPPWGSSFSRVTPLAAPRPNMMSSSLFFFLLLSSVVPSANFLLFCKPSLSKADSNLDGGLLEEVLVWPAAFRFCKSAINELVSEASPLTGVISIPEKSNKLKCQFFPKWIEIWNERAQLEKTCFYNSIKSLSNDWI